MEAPTTQDPVHTKARGLGWVPLLLLLVALPWVVGVSRDHAMGWDESMHAGLPAARMALAMRAGDLVEVAQLAVGCQQYPFVFPMWLGAAQALFGVDEEVARLASRALWPLCLVALWWLGLGLERRTARPGDRAARRWLVPAALVALGATSPLLLAFSGALFLEVPSFLVGTLALGAWVRRDGGHRREVVAGALIALAVFTKFNYGLLLGAGLFLDFVFEGIGALRRRGGRAWLVRVGWLALVPLVSFAWWFVWPWPGGLELGASHWNAFWSFLDGNRGGNYTAVGVRLWELGTFLAAGPVALLLLLVGLLAAVPRAGSKAARAALAVLLVSALAIGEHEFFLDRFLLAVALGAWPLAALGLATVALALPWRGAVTGGALVALLLLAPLVARPLAGPYCDWIGVRTDANAAVLDTYHRQKLDLSPGRALPTAGLARAEFDGVLDLVAAAAGPEGRVAWIGGSSELSSAAVHLGLLERGGSEERFLRDSSTYRAGGEPDFDVTWTSIDPHWSKEQLLEFARRFDVIFTTDPIDLRRRAGRNFMANYRTMLLEDGHFAHERLGAVTIASSFGDPYSVEIFVCRPAPR